MYDMTLWGINFMGGGVWRAAESCFWAAGPLPASVSASGGRVRVSGGGVFALAVTDKKKGLFLTVLYLCSTANAAENSSLRSSDRRRYKRQWNIGTKQ